MFPHPSNKSEPVQASSENKKPQQTLYYQVPEDSLEMFS